jgi:Arc/MetJ-type ribon-helix-helix transcriptional regulator
MKTITVKLDNEMAGAIERLRCEAGYGTVSDLVRAALKSLLVERRRHELEQRLQKYLRNAEALAQAADQVESRLPLTEEALTRAEQ